MPLLYTLLQHRYLKHHPKHFWLDVSSPILYALVTLQGHLKVTGTNLTGKRHGKSYMLVEYKDTVK